MMMTIKDNVVHVDLTPNEAIVLVERLAHATNRANRQGQWSAPCPMPINTGGDHDLPGVVYFRVTADKT